MNPDTHSEDLRFSKDNLPSDPKFWPLWRKNVLTRAIPIEVPFTVETSEGDLHCEFGMLAMDARGYPYPIAMDEFDKIYIPAD